MATKTDAPSAAPFIPEHATLTAMRAAVQGCRGCELYKFATQAVFGEGPAHARIVLVGEQPGNDEDLSGHPFVGPAGKVLDRALDEAGIARKQVYVTNAVKHFKFKEQGKRRLHDTPRSLEINACRPWLQAEVAQLKPHVLVLMGATAARSVLGSKFALMRQRGTVIESDYAAQTIATVHPSAVLRAIEEEGREQMFGFLVEDLKLALRTSAHAAPAARAGLFDGV